MSSSKKLLLHLLTHPSHKSTSAFLYASIKSVHIQNLLLLSSLLFCSSSVVVCH